jgi:tRNA A-37 threonylcarbamoyl transferase component Bud32
VIERYEIYCLTDRVFYDRPDRRGTEHPDFPISERSLPDGWERATTDTWASYAPVDAPVPAQGWKIHVSSCVADAERVLSIAWDYCVPRGIAFKFLRSQAMMVMHNSKSAFRGSSGKLVTIYPLDDGQLELVLKDLDAILAGVKGPYILSDLRYGEGPVFVRYGGFTSRHCLGENGQRVLAIEDPDGRLVPDVRGPTFAVPAWVTLPEFLEPHLAARNAVSIAELPYEFESVLLFSNGGGVYLGRDRRTGERVVLKEGRPYAGLDVLDRDAVTRLAHERDILRRLAGLDVVPAVRDYFTVGDHHFLVQEFIDGTALQRLLVQRYPLTSADRSPQVLAEYTGWAIDMLARVERAVDALHERGVVFGDLHPDNILVTEDNRIVLIDFEVATLAEDHARSSLAHPGFGAPSDRQGVDVDRYALACLHLGLFGPHTTVLLPIHRAKAIHLAEIITDTFPVPADLVERAVETIVGPAGEASDGAALVDLPMPDTDRDSWPRVRDAMRTAILASATPDRDDRLFPGDVNQFRPAGGINLAYGAAGVLYSLAVAGAGRFPDHEGWLRKRALSPAHAGAAGFYDGLHGVAYVLDLLGHRQDALDVVDATVRAHEHWDQLELSLFAGLPGIGLNLLHLGGVAGEPTLTELAHRVVDMCADRLGGPEDVPEIAGGDNPRAGLLYGSAGVALLFLHAYERTGDAALLDKAAVALRQDLRRCKLGDDGSLQVNQGWRTLPYLDEGSAGIGLVLARYLAHREDEAFAAALDAARLVTTVGYLVQSGLFTGRAGLLACRATGLHPAVADAGPDPVVTDLVRGLRWHAMPYGDGLAFSGDQLLRLSMDFATGTAGVLFALATALHERPVFLPFSQPPGGV